MKNRYAVRIGYGFMLLAVAYAFYRIGFADPLGRAASSMVESLRRGDAEALLSAASPEELACSGLTTEKLHGAWNLLLKDHIAGAKVTRSEGGRTNENGYQASASIWFVNRDRSPWRLVMIANQTDRGPRATVLLHMLTTASLFDENGRAANRLTTDLALRGLRRYRLELERLGIHKVMLTPRRCITWDELEAIYEESLAAEAESGAAPEEPNTKAG